MVDNVELVARMQVLVIVVFGHGIGYEAISLEDGLLDVVH